MPVDCSVCSGVVLGLVGVLLVLLVWFRNRRGNNGKPRPPGPGGLPLVGCLLYKEPRFYLFTHSLRHFGPLARFPLAWKDVILLNTVEAVREAFKLDALSGRPQSKLLSSLMHNSGIILKDGDEWKFHRRLTLQILRDFGMGRSVMEHAVLQEAMDLCQHLHSLQGKPLISRSVLSTATSNVICGVVFGDRPGYNPDTDQAKLHKQLEVTTTNTSLAKILPIFILPCPTSVGKLLFSFDDKLTAFIENTNSLQIYLQRRIHEHRAVFREHEEPSDLLFAYLQAQKKAVEQGDIGFNDWKIIQVMFEIFLAGSDTTATTLQWTMLFLAQHEDVRLRAMEEIHGALGKEHWVSVQDKKSLPYIQALVDESVRWGCIAPQGVLYHRALEDTEVLGYQILKGDFLLVNQFSIFRDPKVWRYPDTFDPRNFLDENGEKYVPNENLIPFNLGKRSCLGEALARMELFIFTATIVQRFRPELFHPSSGTPGSLDDVMLGTEGTVRAPGPHQIRFIPL